MDVHNRVKYLKETLNNASEAYYNDSPIMLDYQYDQLNKELRTIEEQYPELIEDDSPTQHVGGTIKSSFAPVTHQYAMLSLEDVFNISDVIDFQNKYQTEFSVEPKIDGLSLQVEYVNGKLYRASTRGNGFIGEDVTENAKCIVDLPNKISFSRPLTVRGEVYMLSEDFANMNQSLCEQGMKMLANARNAAAGTLRQHDTSIIKKRKLHFFAFQMEGAEEHGYRKHTDALQDLKELGFQVVPYRTTNEPTGALRHIEEQRTKLPYGIDGAAIKINDFSIQKECGSSAKFPRWAIAYKYPAEQKETILRKVIYQVGRTGVVTPKAEFDPVDLCGTTVQRATLHNSLFMKNLNLHENDMLTVLKSGDIIPCIVSARRNKNGNPIQFITKCPECGSELIMKDSKYVCMNIMCSAQVVRRIMHFVSKDCMDIDGIGQQLIEKLISVKMIREPVDLYELTSEELQRLDGVGKRKADKIIEAIASSKKVELANVICSLGIENVGYVMAKTLAKNFSGFSDFKNATKHQILQINGVGEVVAANVVNYLSDAKNQSMIRFIEKEFMITNQQEDQSQALQGCIFVITGKFDISRAELKDLITKHGGTVTNKVTAKTTYLVAGQGGGSKRREAENYHTMIINYADVLQKINGV